MVRSILKQSKNDDTKTLLAQPYQQKMFFAMMPPLATMTMEKLLKVAITTHFKTKFKKVYPA